MQRDHITTQINTYVVREAKKAPEDEVIMVHLERNFLVFQIFNHVCPCCGYLTQYAMELGGIYNIVN